MTRAFHGLFLAACLTIASLAATSSNAADSGSMTITVIIPPVAAARQAIAEGALGLWTVDRPAGGLLLAARDGNADQDAELVVYRSERNMLEPAFADPQAAAAMGAKLKINAWTPLNGLQRAAYSVAMAQPEGFVPAVQSVVIVLRSI